MGERALTHSQENKVCQLYQEGYSCSEVADSFGLGSPMTVWRILKRYGVETRSVSEGRRVYSCDESYFDAIDTEEKAYWLGYLCAKSFIGEHGAIVGRIVSVTAPLRHREQLEDLRAALRTDNPLTRFSAGEPHRSYVRLTVRSEHLARIIARYRVRGIAALDSGFVEHYLRGYADAAASQATPRPTAS